MNEQIKELEKKCNQLIDDFDCYFDDFYKIRYSMERMREEIRLMDPEYALKKQKEEEELKKLSFYGQTVRLQRYEKL